MVDKDKFSKQIFKSTGIIEEILVENIGRVQGNWNPKNNLNDLRVHIRDIMWEKIDEYKINTKNNFSDYIIIEECCRIPSDTMKKALNGRYTITRRFLAKFTVGLKLSLDEANLLFTLHSGELNLTNDFDYIIFYALKTKDDIDDFIEEIKSLTGINLDKTR